MAVPAVPSTYAGVAEAVAVVVLLSEFAMLRTVLLRSQVRIYAMQSLAVVVLAAVAGVTRHLDDLFVLAALSFVLKVVVVPGVVLRLIGETRSDLAGSHRLGVATMVLLALVLTAVGLLVTASLPITSRILPTSALGIAAAVVLVAFALVVLRRDVISQAVGFFSMENGVFLASMVLAAGLPLIVEVAFLFDLLVAVVVFGVLMRVHHLRTRTLSTDTLDRLRG